MFEFSNSKAPRESLRLLFVYALDVVFGDGFYAALPRFSRQPENDSANYIESENARLFNFSARPIKFKFAALIGISRKFAFACFSLD